MPLFFKVFMLLLSIENVFTVEIEKKESPKKFQLQKGLLPLRMFKIFNPTYHRILI